MPTRVLVSTPLTLALVLSLAAPSNAVQAQRGSPPGGSPRSSPRSGPREAPRATPRPAPPRAGPVWGARMGPAAPAPAPIGGLRTRPLNAPVPVGEYRRQGRRPGAAYRDGFRDGYRYGNGYGAGYGIGYGIGYGVIDAPLQRGGVVVYGNAAPSPRAPAWYPTGDRPRWRVDSSLVPVQAWRDLIVNDVVCDGYGTCMEREQRVRAPWIASCRCYLFTDALGRRWEVLD